MLRRRQLAAVQVAATATATGGIGDDVKRLEDHVDVTFIVRD